MRPLPLAIALAAVLASATAEAQDTAPGADESQGDVPREVNPSRPPPRGLGALWGEVRDRKSGETLLDAQLTVLERRTVKFSDIDGRYRFELPPGRYSIRVVADFHQYTRVRNVVVRAGVVTRLDVPLDADSRTMEETVSVEAEVERASDSTQLLLRRNSAGSSDAVGSQDIAKTPDRNAADAIRRVVGATVTDNRYVLVRGLGDRYTNAQLNGSPLPSPEPDKQAVPLDMFPTLVMSDLVIRKTFTPDLPGDFAGGSLDIHTRDVPNKFFFSGSLGVGFNTQSTFRKRLSHPGGGLDFLGIDDGGRKLPSEVPAERITRLRRDGSVNPNLTTLGRAINGPMETSRAFTLPNGTGNFVFGDGFKLGPGHIGYLLGGGYSRRFQLRADEVIRTYGVDASKPGQLIRFNDYRSETGLDTVTWSTLGTVGYTLNENHRVFLTGLYSRNAEKEGRTIQGFNDEQGANIRDERVRFVNRGLAYGQLRGEHRFSPTSSNLPPSTLDWRALYARANLSDPNLRETIYQEDSDTGYAFRESSQSGQHFYASQGENTRSLAFDFTQPLRRDKERPINLKVGSLLTLRSRDFSARRFRFLRVPGSDDATFRQRPDLLFTDANVGPQLELAEWTAPTDTYRATYDVIAGYLMSDVAIGTHLRAVVGARLESSVQTVDSFDPFDANAGKVSSKLARTDLLPSASLVYKVTRDLNIRASATRTVARPQLRELAPFVFTEFLGAREVLGNPNLDRTSIQNYDVRVEFFPSPNEVLAASVFHKRFASPIEPTILPTSRGVLSFQNAEGAETTGIELEVRKNLAFVARPLSPFSLLGNFTVLESQVKLDQKLVGLLTNTSRALAGQSPYIFNVALDFQWKSTSARILYNVFGPRIAQVGQNGLPDTYEQPRHTLDLSVVQGVAKGVDVKLSLENLLDSPFRLTQGAASDAPLANRYTLGRTAWATVQLTL